MKSFKEFINERLWYDKIATYISRSTFAKADYEHALKALSDVIKRKGVETGGKLAHDINYYANAVARTYTDVDGRELADMYLEITQ